jgi:DNA invertase Pin-like site-specific DNA recombinase
MRKLYFRGPKKPTIAVPRRAAQYVRMSADQQRYSIENQQQVIARYALSHGIEVVRTYVDAGRSGLTFDNRQAMKQLVFDVCEGSPDFNVILVFDLSRWGRFQDVDESAYYEFTCKMAGIPVEYCDEQFENDGSI